MSVSDAIIHPLKDCEESSFSSLILFSSQVRDSVMTRVSLSWSQDNEVTIAGLGMLPRLGLHRADLQVRIQQQHL